MLKRFWREEAGDVVTNLGIMVTITIGLLVIVVPLIQSLTNVNWGFKGSLDGVTIGE